MKRLWPVWGILTIAILGAAAAGQAQILWNGQGHIPEEYRVDWSQAGLLPETPTVADHFFDVTRQEGATLDQKLTSAIQEAMAATQDGINGQVAIVYFPPGVHQLTRPVILGPEHSNIIFQGAGSHRTILEARFGSGYGNVFDLRGRTGFVQKVDQDIPKGATTLISQDLSSAFFPGDWICFYETEFPFADPGNVGQVTQLVAVDGSTGIMKDPANLSYAAQTEKYLGEHRGHEFWEIVQSLWIQKVEPVMNVGIENLTIRRLDGDKPPEGAYGDGRNICMDHAVNCWIKGVELNNAARYHVGIGASAHIAISGCYIHDANDHGGGGYGYGVALGASTTNCLIENNIFRKLRHSMIVGSGANGNVFTYNYSREGHAKWGIFSYVDSDLNLHGRYPYANLYEQNYVQEIEADDTHGLNGPYNVFLRNKVHERAEIDLWHLPLTGFLGNDLLDHSVFDLHGGTSFSAEFYGKLGLPYESAPTLSHTRSAWYAVEKDAARLQDISYYYSGRPGFLDSRYTFPSLGPRFLDGWPTTGSIPARERYHDPAAINTYLGNPTGYTVLMNPGFEEGQDFWLTYGDGLVEASSDDAHGGSLSAYIDRAAATGHYFGLYQETISVKPNTDYRLHLWVKTGAASGYVAAALGVWSSDPELNHHSDFGYIGGDTDWTRITGTWRSRPGESVIQVALFGSPDFAGEAYFDGLVLEEVMPRNRSFENGLKYWESYGDGTDYAPVEGGIEGTDAASISREGTTGNYFGLVQRRIPCQPNTTYRLSLWVATEAQSGFAAVGFGNWETPNTHRDFGYIQGDSGWVQISGTWTSRWDETSLDIALFGSPDFSGRAFLDELVLEELGREPQEVFLEGPTSLRYKQRGTFTAAVTGGSGDYDYEWFLQYDGGGTWTPLDSRNETQMVAMLNEGFVLRVGVYDRITGLKASGRIHIAYEDEPPDNDLQRLYRLL